jgi:hypothetical protein
MAGEDEGEDADEAEEEINAEAETLSAARKVDGYSSRSSLNL